MYVDSTLILFRLEGQATRAMGMLGGGSAFSAA